MGSTALRAVALALLAAGCTSPLGGPPATPAGPAPSVETAGPRQLPNSASPGPSASPTEAGSAGPSPATATSGAEGAPGFTLAALDGRTISLGDQRGHPVWVAFWAPGCVSCEPTLLAMDELYREHKASGLSVIAVAVATDRATAEAYATALGLSYPVVLDGDGAVFLEYGALFLPAHYWIDGDGMIRDWAAGDVPPDVLADAVGRLVPSG